MSRTTSWLLPAGTLPDARLILLARGLRAFGDGFVSLLLPFYLTLLGYSPLEVGIIAAATLLGAGVMTLGVGFISHRYRSRTLLLAASVLLTATGVAMVLVNDFWPLLLVATVGTLNPSTGDVNVFSPIEHALLAHTADPRSRTALFARYSWIGALVGALGAQAAGVPALLIEFFGVTATTAAHVMFLLYGGIGLASLAIYLRLSPDAEAPKEEKPVPLGKSRRTVYTLAALFSIDSFGGGFAVQSLLALWLFQRYDLSLAATATLFFWSGILAAFSQLLAAKIAARIGLINTMVFTHLPSNIFLILVPFMPNLTLALIFLLLRSALSQMDVPTRTSYVMAVVSPAERPAAASMTAVPRSFTAAISPAFAGYLLTLSTFGWPLVICGGLKIVYDLLLLRMFQKVKPPEER